MHLVLRIALFPIAAGHLGTGKGLPRHINDFSQVIGDESVNAVASVVRLDISAFHYPFSNQLDLVRVELQRPRGQVIWSVPGEG